MVPAEIRLQVDRMMGHLTTGTPGDLVGEQSTLKCIARKAAPYIGAYNAKIKATNESMAEENMRIQEKLKKGAISPKSALK